MELGVSFPQYEIGADPIAVRDYAQAAEDLGYRHLSASEHVVGANPESRENWTGPYTHEHMFHEPFALMGYLAAVTRRLKLVVGALVLPQRQTALVAKQAAAVDVLSGGRLRLGVVVGWNDVEYEALGQQFRNRGRRIEEQIAVLRALWAQELATFEGQWHRITEAGINPLPVQRPTPIWMGGGVGPALRRIASLADGWLCPDTKGYDVPASPTRLLGYVREAGRDPATFGVEGVIIIANTPLDKVIKVAEWWRSLGATHLKISTLNGGLTSPQDHIDAIRRVKEALDPMAASDPVKQSHS